MRTRILRPDEWHRIKSPGLPDLLMFCEPQNVAMVVVEDDAGEIAASVCALQVTHFEGLWIEPKHRGNAGIFRALIRQAFALPRVRQERWVFGAAQEGDERMASVCSRLGGRQVPMELFVMPVGD